MSILEICLLGADGAGKHALMCQFTLNGFPSQADYVPASKELLVDTEPTQVVGIVMPSLLLLGRWTAFLLVYSVTSRLSFEAVDQLARQARGIKGAGALFALVGTKCDLTDEREVTEQEGRDLARALGCDFCETSAKMAINVEVTFEQLVRRLRTSRQSQMKSESKGKAQTTTGRERKHTHCAVM
ncbi:P-loop containing nucleoside triphosphate hydrolase protein [Coprinopsis sp. MPI-PUGE-AT-0042]|nr:P-loop containing nucleoside triphosphate hydrolase protein [Coprinopsis sp. MPI-PUGE-AT-0042]